MPVLAPVIITTFPSSLAVDLHWPPATYLLRERPAALRDEVRGHPPSSGASGQGSAPRAPAERLCGETRERHFHNLAPKFLLPAPAKPVKRCTRTQEKKKLIREFDEKQREANETLREMEEELKYAPLPFRNQMMSKIRAYRRDLSMFQREMRSTDLGLGPGSQGNMKYGIFSTENEQSTNLQSQRVMLLQGTDSLNRASQSIERSHRIAAETDQIGTDIIEELGEQREQLERTKSRLVNTSENLSKSRKILRSMSRRVTTNKLLLSIIIILELAILGGVVYYKFFRNR
ncbi:PREDICTED: vesicle transport through interaction with t-SNAREs homolog 1B [Haliaeetus leucocephalus]|uniref:vesicle transport through interaction with t-SNAREs homolog 1B n=1 Tax=Haliaeetus leucocephalus TaxID=52644 RepID=UPI00053CD273|nr:PREDICTED: vesicle transport through interaction with t-SNAREs homolog 1B [Haliaeetus leucocephalus]